MTDPIRSVLSLSTSGLFKTFALGAALLTAGAVQAAGPAEAQMPLTAKTDARPLVEGHLVEGQGGPLIPVAAAVAVELRTDQQFRSLFQSWKKMDMPGSPSGVIAIPSVHPVEHLEFTSNFGIRTDPFRGTAAMHAGVDIRGPVGTPIYATADGIVSEAQRQGGYGNLVEINHGKGIATRYGHLSKILVTANMHVKRGQLIALMGSTGRSTGSHLHYEVRIDGHAVNPAPFLTTADYLVAAQDHSVNLVPVSTNGPAPQD